MHGLYVKVQAEDGGERVVVLPTEVVHAQIRFTGLQWKEEEKHSYLKALSDI